MQFSVILFTSHSELRIIENNSHDHLRRSSVDRLEIRL